MKLQRYDIQERRWLDAEDVRYGLRLLVDGNSYDVSDSDYSGLRISTQGPSLVVLPLAPNAVEINPATQIGTWRE